MVGRLHLERVDEAFGQLLRVAAEFLPQAPGMVLHLVFAAAAVGLALLAGVGPGERRLDAVGGVVGEGQAHGAGRRDRQQVAVADAMLADRLLDVCRQAAGEGAGLQVAVGIEQREGAFFLRQRDRGAVGGITHGFGDARGHRAAGFAVVAQVQQRQRVAHAGEADADAALGLGFLVLLRQRPPGQVEHVVERAHLECHHLLEGGEVETGLAITAEGVAHEARQDHRAQVAAAVGRQGLLAAVVHHQAIGIEGMDIVHRHVVDGFLAVGLQRFDGGNEALAVELAPVAGERLLQSRGLVLVGKADPVGEQAQVVAADDQLMLGQGRVLGITALAVGQQAQAGRPAVAVQRGYDAQAQQHALRSFEQLGVALRQADAHALVLRALHAAVGIEQAAQHACGESRGLLLDRRRDALVANAQPQAEGQITQCSAGQAGFAAVSQRTLEALEVGTMRQRGGSGLGRLHDAIAGAQDRTVLADQAQLGRPDRQHGLVGLQRAVTQQQADQVAFGLVALTAPAGQCPVIVEHDLVARLQLAGLHPVEFQAVTGLAGDTAHAVVGGQAQAVALAGTQAQHRLVSGLEETLALQPVAAAVDHGLEILADQAGDLARPVLRHDPGVSRDTGVGRGDGLAVAQVVVGVDVVQEQDARLGEVVGRLHHGVPELARRQGLVDPEAVFAPVGAGGQQGFARHGAVHQMPVGISDHGLHEGVRHADRDVEVVPATGGALGGDELAHIRVVDAQHTHLGAAARAGAFDR